MNVTWHPMTEVPQKHLGIVFVSPGGKVMQTIPPESRAGMLAFQSMGFERWCYANELAAQVFAKPEPANAE